MLWTGNLDDGVWTAGTLVHDILTVVELIDHIVAEAPKLITGRLAAALGS